MASDHTKRHRPARPPANAARSEAGKTSVSAPSIPTTETPAATAPQAAEAVRVEPAPAEPVAAGPTESATPTVTVPAEAAPAGVMPEANEPGAPVPAEPAPAAPAAPPVETAATPAPAPGPTGSATRRPLPPEEPVLTPSAPESPRRHGASVWLAIPIGAIAGAAAAAAVAYGLATHQIAGETADLSAALARISALEARQSAAGSLAGVTQRLDKLETGGEGQIATLRKAQETLQASLQAATAAATGAGQQAGSLGTRLDAVQKRVDEVAAAATALDRSVASVAVLGSIRGAILDGRPFAPELEAARVVLGPAAAALDPLAPYAASGFAPPAVLAQRLADAARSARPVPAGKAEASSSLFGRLLSNAESLVSVQSADAPIDNSVQQAIDGAVAAVRAGDFERAGAQIEALPAPVKERLGADLATVVARRNGLATTTTLYQQALAAISGKVP